MTSVGLRKLKDQSASLGDQEICLGAYFTCSGTLVYGRKLLFVHLVSRVIFVITYSKLGSACSLLQVLQEYKFVVKERCLNPMKLLK